LSETDGSIKIEDNYFGKILDDSLSGNNPIE